MSGSVRVHIFLAVLLHLVLLSNATGAEIEERPDFARHFEQAGTPGTIVVHDVAADKTMVYNRARAETAYLPASTFKVPAALIALETGVVKDAYKDVLPWDGVEWIAPACNADQTLATALARSCMPFFARLGKKIGDQSFDTYLAKFDYGNHDASGAYPYWIKGALRISAFEQIAFLDKLRRDALPASSENMQTVRKIMVIDEGDNYVMHAKTGWAMDTNPDIGWIVGWVERDGKVYLFALNIDIYAKEAAAARLGITKAVLTDLGVLP